VPPALQGDLHVVVLNRPTPSDLAAARAVVNSAAVDWWPYTETIWVVQGLDARDWRDRIGAVITRRATASVLVVQVPRESAPKWWTFAAGDEVAKAGWLASILG
jgi:hypothetical protein